MRDQGTRSRAPESISGAASGDRSRALAGLALALSLAGCGAVESTAPDDSEARDLRAFFEGSAPIPDEAGRDEHRRTLALLSVRASGARRSGVEIDTEDGWSPIVEQATSDILPVDTRVWQRDGDFDASGAFVPLRSSCRPTGPLDLADLPEEVTGPRRDERAVWLACALDRLAGEELSIRWTPHLPHAALLDPEGGSALVNPRWIALVEPEESPLGPGAAGIASLPGAAPHAIGEGQSDGEPGAGPLASDDNSHHPRPPDNDGGGSSRTFCDRVCDDIWNDAFDCDCDNSLGSSGGGCDCGGDTGESGGDGCDCGGGPGESDTADDGGCDCGSSPGRGGGGGGGLGGCKCSQGRRGGRDRMGVTLSAVMAGTLVVRRGRRWRGLAQRVIRNAQAVISWAASRVRGVAPFLFLGVITASLVDPTSAIAAPPQKLVDVHVTVVPAEAAVFVDGNAVVPVNNVVRVPAGSHTFSAQLEGYAAATQTVDVRDGGTGTLVTLRLTADKGYLIITGSNPTLTLLIDGSPAGRGSYSGLVTPGNHVVTAVAPTGESRSYLVTALAGQSVSLSTDAPSSYVPPPSPAPAPAPTPSTPPSPPKKVEPPKPRLPPVSGPYVLVNLNLVWQTGRPYGFEHRDTPGPGFVVGGRGGYRFNDGLGLEALLEYGRIENGGFVVQTYDVDQDGDGALSAGEGATDRGRATYLLESLRFGPVLRFTSTGRVHRFVGGLGAGALHENIALEHRNLVWNAATERYDAVGTYRHNFEGWTPYLLAEGGYERNIQSFLVGLLFQLTLESVSGLEGDPYNSGLQARMGLSLRGGYALW